MDDNQLGRNIQHLRKIHGETLEELGNKIGYAKTTVKGYENGSRKPDLETLQAISDHYDQTVDELLHTDLTDLEPLKKETMASGDIFALFAQLLPLQCSTINLQNQHFRKSYALAKRCIDSSSVSDIQSSEIFSDMMEGFSSAYDETGAIEALANNLWAIFLYWGCLKDYNTTLEIQKKAMAPQINIAEFYELYKHDSPDIAKLKESFIEECDSEINQMIALLKADIEWADLGDYYLALRYVFNMVDTGLSQKMNNSIGIQMLIALTKIGNSYAYTFLKIGTEF